MIIGFEIGLDRMRKYLSIAVAVERLVALYWPQRYYTANHSHIMQYVFKIGLIWSILDALAMISEDDLNKVRNFKIKTLDQRE